MVYLNLVFFFLIKCVYSHVKNKVHPFEFHGFVFQDIIKIIKNHLV